MTSSVETSLIWVFELSPAIISIVGFILLRPHPSANFKMAVEVHKSKQREIACFLRDPRTLPGRTWELLLWSGEGERQGEAAAERGESDICPMHTRLAVREKLENLFVF